MAMGRKGPTQPSLWIPNNAAARAPGHRFYEKLNGLLRKHGFDAHVEGLCHSSYASDAKQGRRSIPPGTYFRMLLIGYFEGIESERGICWRCSDSLSLRDFLGLELDEPVPDHSTLSRIRSRLGSELYEQVFEFALAMVNREGLLRGRVVGVDATYLRADASMKSIVRKETNEEYKAYLKRLAQEAGIEKPTDEDARRMDRRRKKKASNKEWASPTDPDARIGRLKDGRTRLAHKAENAVDLETGAIIAAEIHPADAADTATIIETAEAAREHILAALEVPEVPEVSGGDEDERDVDDDESPSSLPSRDVGPPVDLVGDKGYYSARTLQALAENGFRTFIAEPIVRGKRHWTDKGGREAAELAYNNRKRCRRSKGKRLHRLRGELLERPFAHLCETGGARRTRLRGRENIQKWA